MADVGDEDGEEVFFSSLLSMADARGLGRFTRRLWQAERARASRMFELLVSPENGVLGGIDALLLYLDALEEWAGDRLAGAVRVLVQRMRGDVEAFAEAMLSSSQGACSDAARDLMEVEFLLREFAASPARAEAWMGSDRAALVREFGPAAVRAREAERRSPGERIVLPDESEYRVHSQVTHPTPAGGRARDLASDVAPFPLPYAAAELLEHAVRCLLALDPMRDESAPDPAEAEALFAAYYTARDAMDSLIAGLPPVSLPDRMPRPKGEPPPLAGM